MDYNPSNLILKIFKEGFKVFDKNIAELQQSLVQKPESIKSEPDNNKIESSFQNQLSNNLERSDNLVSNEKVENLLKEIKEFCESQNFHELDEEFQIIDANKSNQHLNLILLGEISAGKTTLLNLLISYDPDTKTFKKDYINLLPTHEYENTGFLWTISKSLTEQYRIKFSDEEYQVFENLKDLKKKLLEYNNLQKENVKVFKVPEEGKEYKLKEIRLEIPKIMDNIRIIDFPGISCTRLIEEFRKKIKNQLIAFLVVKNFDSKENLSENIIKSMKIMSGTHDFQSEKDLNLTKNEENAVINDQNSKSFIKCFVIFTKKDKLLEITQDNKNDYLALDDDIDENDLINKIKKDKIKRGLEVCTENISLIENSELSIINVFALNQSLLKDSVLNSQKIKEFKKEIKIFDIFNTNVQEMIESFNSFYKNLFICKKLNKILFGFAKIKIELEKKFDANLNDIGKSLEKFDNILKQKTDEYFSLFSDISRLKKEKASLLQSIKKEIESQISSSKISCVRRNNFLTTIARDAGLNIFECIRKDFGMESAEIIISFVYQNLQYGLIDLNQEPIQININNILKIMARFCIYTLLERESRDSFLDGQGFWIRNNCIDDIFNIFIDFFANNIEPIKIINYDFCKNILQSQAMKFQATQILNFLSDNPIKVKMKDFFTILEKSRFFLESKLQKLEKFKSKLLEVNIKSDLGESVEDFIDKIPVEEEAKIN